MTPNLTVGLLAAAPLTTSLLAQSLNAAMAASVEAQIAYLETYGVEWAPLGDGSEVDHSFASGESLGALVREIELDEVDLAFLAIGAE